MTYPITVWRSEHVDFLRVLSLLEKRAATFHTGRKQNYHLMRNIFYYLRRVPDINHHPREEFIFNRLLNRKPELKLQIERTLQEHQAIAMTGQEFLNRLDQAAEDIVIPPGTMETGVASYVAHYRHHIATEERDLIPLADLLLNRKDWAAMAAAIPAVADPLYADKVESRFRELRRQIELEA